MTAGHQELLLDRHPGADEESVRLLSPGVGWLTEILPAGIVLVPGQAVGRLVTLGCTVTLRVPDGVAGRVSRDPPPEVRRAVGWGDEVYRLERVEGGGELGGGRPEEGARQDGRLVVEATQSGRFYHRPSPGEPPWVEPGQVVEEGSPIGLIEVMKTFSQVVYRPVGPLPARARVVAHLTEDGGDVVPGDALIEVEAASAGE